MLGILLTPLIIYARASMAGDQLPDIKRVPIIERSTTKTHTIRETEDGHRRALTGSLTTQLEVGETLYETTKATTPTAPPPRSLDICLLQHLAGRLVGEVERVLKAEEKYYFFDNMTEFIPDTQFAVAGFIDYPIAEYGRVGDFVYNVTSSMSPNRSDWLNGINWLKDCDGYDVEDAQYDAIVAAAGNDTDPDFCFDDPEVGQQKSCGWRTSPPADYRVMVVMTDVRDLGFHVPSEGDEHHKNDKESTLAVLQNQNIKIIGLQQGTGINGNDELYNLANKTGGAFRSLEYGQRAEYTNNTLESLKTFIPLTFVGNLTYDVTLKGTESQHLNISLSPERIQDVDVNTTYNFNISIGIDSNASLVAGSKLNATVSFYWGDTLIHDLKIAVDVEGTTPPPKSTSAPPTTTSTQSTTAAPSNSSSTPPVTPTTTSTHTTTATPPANTTKKVIRQHVTSTTTKTIIETVTKNTTTYVLESNL